MRASVALSLWFVVLTACSTPVAAPQQTSPVGSAAAGSSVQPPMASAGTPAASAPITQPKAGAPSVSSSSSSSSAPSMPASTAGSAGAAVSSGAGSGGMRASAGSSAAAGMSAGAPAAPPSTVGHPKRFIASIHGDADKLVYVNVDDAKQNWELNVKDGIQDFQLIGSNKLLVGYKFSFGFLEVDLETHKVVADVRDFLTRDEAILTSVKRLANGHTLIMAQGLKDANSLQVWEVDNAKMVYQKRSFKGCCGNLRVVRLTSEGHFLVGADSALVELDDTGKEVARLNTGGSPTYMGLKTADGTYYATNGHGGQLLAFAPGGERKVLGGRSSPSASKVTIYQPAQFQILQNGNVVITNWTAENGGKGQQLVEYDRDGNMVWSWDDAAVRPQGMETLLILDDLDPAALNDDRDGVLKPLH